MPTPIATVPGIDLYQDGVYFKAEAQGCLASFYALTISQEGFTPISHVSAIEVSEVRDFQQLIGAIIFIPLLGIGILLLLLWVLRPLTVLRVRSDGEIFATTIIDKSHRNDALEMVNKYRRLKHALAQRAKS